MPSLRAFVAALLALSAVAASVPAAAADLRAGERAFRTQCMACHSLEAGRNRAGPTLHALFGRPAASVEGFDYSDAMEASGIVWTEETLDAFLADPRAYVPGTRMVFWGLEARPRADLIAYLKTATEGEAGTR